MTRQPRASDGLQKVSCIIPAHNEGERIGEVLRAVERHPLIDEVIVVDDGSTDHTAKAILACKRARLIMLKPNRGKSYAVMRGIAAARNDIVMMLDADLVGLTRDDLDELIIPVLSGVADITISLRNNSLLIYKLIGIDFVSGERVFHKSAIGPLDCLGKLRSYGLEVYFNKRIIKSKSRLRIVKWRKVISVRKGDKVGFFTGLRLETGMVLQILKTVGLREVLYQMWKMRSLSRRSKASSD